MLRCVDENVTRWSSNRWRGGRNMGGGTSEVLCVVQSFDGGEPLCVFLQLSAEPVGALAGADTFHRFRVFTLEYCRCLFDSAQHGSLKRKDGKTVKPKAFFLIFYDGKLAHNLPHSTAQLWFCLKWREYSWLLARSVRQREKRQR